MKTLAWRNFKCMNVKTLKSGFRFEAERSEATKVDKAIKAVDKAELNERLIDS